MRKWCFYTAVFGNPVSFITQSIEYFSGIYKYFTVLIPDTFHRFKPTFDFFLCKCSDIKDIGLRKISKYYLNLLDCWSEFLSLNKINTKENILGQHIFGNSKIRYKRIILCIHLTCFALINWFKFTIPIPPLFCGKLHTFLDIWFVLPSHIKSHMMEFISITAELEWNLQLFPG
jgi:hypothetical protein